MSDWPEHYCAEGRDAAGPGDRDEFPGYGSAVNYIRRDPRGQWWAISVMDEYASPIRFCPYCGERL